MLRRRGRRPTLPLVTAGSEPGSRELAGSDRRASSVARSRERRVSEEHVLREGLTRLIVQWMERGEFERLKCIELLFVLGRPNKEAAVELGISEQAVANHKHFALAKLKDWVSASTVGEVSIPGL